MINFTGLNISTQTTYTGDLPDICKVKGNEYSLECIYKNICPQFNKHFVKVGMILIISYILMCWILWFFMNHGYKYFNWTDGMGYFNLNHIENRIYIDNWIRTRFNKLLLGYVAMVVYLSW